MPKYIRLKNSVASCDIALFKREWQATPLRRFIPKNSFALQKLFSGALLFVLGKSEIHRIKKGCKATTFLSANFGDLVLSSQFAFFVSFAIRKRLFFNRLAPFPKNSFSLQNYFREPFYMSLVSPSFTA